MSQHDWKANVMTFALIPSKNSVLYCVISPAISACDAFEDRLFITAATPISVGLFNTVVNEK